MVAFVGSTSFASINTSSASIEVSAEGDKDHKDCKKKNCKKCKDKKACSTEKSAEKKACSSSSKGKSCCSKKK